MSEVEYFSWKGEKALWTEQIAWTKLRGPEKMRLLGGSKELQGFQKGSPAARGRAAGEGLRRPGSWGFAAPCVLLSTSLVLVTNRDRPQETIPWTQPPCPKGLPGVLTTTGMGAVLEQKGRKAANTTFSEPEVEKDVLF